MQERGPDCWICPGCGFGATQLNIWELVELVEFNKTTPEYTKITTYTMNPEERAALEDRERGKRARDIGKDVYTTAPQKGLLGGKKYRKSGGEIR